ncbi:hypothetical protein [Synechococcus phage S-SRP01]|uniref:Uncharacterized protein n=1 Tax=Synechococcus phage S-SRP01 TaxID=2781607 RepID=A0A874M8D2_9CAUD|nr:hypothetical protein [Synechococcus phage S-SRP01]
MARTKNNFLNAKPVSKMGGGSGGVRKPSKPYSKPPAAKKATPKVTPKAAKPAPKAPDPWKAPTPKNSRTSAPKGNTTFRTNNTGITMPNSRRAGVNLPQTGARAERTAARVADLRKASAPKPTPAAPKPSAASRPNTSLLRGSFGQGAGALQLGLMGAEFATQAGYARGGKNYKEFVRAQDRVPAKPAAKPAAKAAKPALSSTGVRVSDKANQRDYKAAPTGSKQYNDYRNRQIAGERERLKGVGNPPKAKPPAPPRRNPPAPVADQRRSGAGGNNAAPRSQTPPAPRFTGTVDEGRKTPAPPRRNPPAPVADQRRSGAGGNNAAPRSQTPPAPRFTGTVDEGRKMWAEKYSSSKYDGQAIQKEAKKLLDEMKKRKEDKSNAQRAGWDGNKNY